MIYSGWLKGSNAAKMVEKLAVAQGLTVKTMTVEKGWLSPEMVVFSVQGEKADVHQFALNLFRLQPWYSTSASVWDAA